MGDTAELVRWQIDRLQERIQRLQSTMLDTVDGPLDTYSERGLESLAAEGLYVARGAAILMPNGQATIFSGYGKWDAIAEHYASQGHTPLSFGLSLWIEDGARPTVSNQFYVKDLKQSGPIRAPLGSIIFFLEASGTGLRLLGNAEATEEQLLREIHDSTGLKRFPLLKRGLKDILGKVPVRAYAVGEHVEVDELYNRLLQPR